MKKKYFMGTIICLSILLFLIINPFESKKSNTISTTKVSKKSVKKGFTSDSLKPQRTPAATNPIKDSSPKFEIVSKERVIVGEKLPLRAVSFSNSVNPNWKENYKNRFFKHIPKGKVKDFKIEKKKSILKVHKKVGTYLEHVLVSFIRPDGTPFSFEALINSQTGIAIQTWNKTRYEFRDSLKLDASGRELSPLRRQSTKL